MPHAPAPPSNATMETLLERTRALAPRFAERAQAAEEARRIPSESVNEMLEAGFARVLLPRRIGGYGLGFDTWFEVVRELSKVDASHAWCAGLIIHHAHLIAQYPEQAQQALWANGLDVPIAASFAPNTQVIAVDGGHLISGNAPFASGVDYCAWVMLGGMVHDVPTPEWKLFLVPPGEYKVHDTWFTAGMRATGSKTIVTNNAFVPDGLTLSLAELGDGKAPGSALYPDVIFHTPFFYYAPISFAAPMLGAAQGVYELFRGWIRGRRTQTGVATAETTSIQVRMARAAADIDAADLLLRRAVRVTDAPELYSPTLLYATSRACPS